jgi:exonuclease SbcC
MRPLELALRNFRSYYTPRGREVVFDFRDRRLIGIVGPIGSGKSSILDAIAFALYGRTPRIARSTKSLIHQRAEEAAVRLRFEVEGEIWEAVRSMRAGRGASQHALYRYEADKADLEPVEKIVQESEVNDKVAQLLGFDFEAFGRSVLLAQGQFAEFLNARPAERNNVLKGVFGHDRIDRMRELAKTKVKDTEFEIDKLQIRLDNAEQAMASLAQRREQHSAAAERAGLLASKTDEVAELQERHLTASRSATEAADRLDSLQRQTERMPDASKTEELLALAETARAERARLAADLEKAHAARAAAEEVLKSDEVANLRSIIEEATNLLTEHRVRRGAVEAAIEQHDAARARVATIIEAADRATERVAVAEAAVAAADELRNRAQLQIEAVEQALHEARHANMAASLRAELVDGGVCPVCAQQVDTPPAQDARADITEAEAAVARARSELGAALDAYNAAFGELAGARTAAEDADQRATELGADVDKLAAVRDQATAAVEKIDAQITELLGGDDHEVAVAGLRDDLTKFEDEAGVARRGFDEARRALDEAITREQETDRALGDLRTQLGALSTILQADADLPEDDPAALREAVGALRDRWSAETHRLRETVETQRTSAAQVSQQLADLLGAIGVPGSFEKELAEANAAVEILGKAIAEDEATVADAHDLLAARSDQVERGERFRRIASDLTDSRFIKYLLDEERAALSELGSDHFQRLSSGRYRFTQDGSFEVVDLTAADAIRRPDSLSGGETFLASLGLALGLAEMVSRTGGRLDSFFLDEGFGSLDPEHLDLAMDGIEQLVADGGNRLVVIVSHVPEMRQRMEDLIVLDRDPTTGDSVVVAGAGA